MNDEPKYETYMHIFSPSFVKTLTVMGKIDISYVGFGPKGTSSKIYVKNESLNDHKQCQH